MPNTIAESYVLTTGTESAGDVSDTEVRDGVHHEHTDDAGALELYYQFDIGADGVPSTLVVVGRINGNDDTLDGIFAFNWGTSTWERVGDFIGQGGPADLTRSYTFLTQHVGTGANRGLVRGRFFAAAGLTAATLAIDQICLTFDVVVRSPGYEDGAVWVDTNGSNSNAEFPFDGTSSNPVNSWANALVINTARGGPNKFRIATGSLITLIGDTEFFDLVGDSWDLDMNEQSIAGSYFRGAHDVIGNGFGGDCTFERCTMSLGGVTTVGPCLMVQCGLAGSFGFNLSGGVYTLDQCYSILSLGVLVREIDTGLAIGDITINVRHHSGDLSISNMGQSGVDLLSLEGNGTLIINSSCVGGIIRRIGRWAFTDNSGSVTIINDDQTNDLINLKQRVTPAFRGVAFDSIPWLFVANSDGRTPVTSAVDIIVTRSIDGSAFAAGTGSFTEIGNGMYSYDASAADMDGAVIVFRFNATAGNPGAPDVTFKEVTTGDAP